MHLLITVHIEISVDCTRLEWIVTFFLVATHQYIVRVALYVHTYMELTPALHSVLCAQ